MNTFIVDVLSHCYGKPIRSVAVPESEILNAINGVRTNLMKDRSNELESEDNGIDELSDSLKIDVTDAEDDDAPIIRYVNTSVSYTHLRAHETLR